MRFISEDPLGFGGGDVNLQAYTLNSPTNLRDPRGTNPIIGCAAGGGMNAAFGFIADKITGRKVTWHSLLRDAGQGCVMGAGGAIVSELLLAPVIEMASPYVASLFSGEAGAAVEASGEGVEAEAEEAGVESEAEGVPGETCCF